MTRLNNIKIYLEQIEREEEKLGIKEEEDYQEKVWENSKKHQASCRGEDETRAQNTIRYRRTKERDREKCEKYEKGHKTHRNGN